MNLWYLWLPTSFFTYNSYLAALLFSLRFLFFADVTISTGVMLAADITDILSASWMHYRYFKYFMNALTFSLCIQSECEKIRTRII